MVTAINAMEEGLGEIQVRTQEIPFRHYQISVFTDWNKEIRWGNLRATFIVGLGEAEEEGYSG
jgi:hypothetical protein